MAMRVATFASSDRLLQAALRVQARQAEATEQEASGLVSSDYGGLGRSAGSLVRLETSISRSEAYVTAATSADSRISAMYSAVGSMVDALTNFKSDLVSVDETTADTDLLTQSAQSALEQLVSLMNTSFDGDYVFAGAMVDTEPVNLDGVASPTTPSSADTSYYQGDDGVASVRVSAERVISYGVTADDPSFEKAIRALSLVAGGATDDDTLAEASDLLETAVDGLTTVQAGLSVNASSIETAISDAEDYQTFAGDLVANLADVDVATVAARMSSYETQLEAAYAAIGKIQSLSLADYLK